MWLKCETISYVKSYPVHGFHIEDDTYRSATREIRIVAIKSNFERLQQLRDADKGVNLFVK